MMMTIETAAGRGYIYVYQLKHTFNSNNQNENDCNQLSNAANIERKSCHEMTKATAETMGTKTRKDKR